MSQTTVITVNIDRHRLENRKSHHAFQFLSIARAGLQEYHRKTAVQQQKGRYLKVGFLTQYEVARELVGKSSRFGAIE